MKLFGNDHEDFIYRGSSIEWDNAKGVYVAYNLYIRIGDAVTKKEIKKVVDGYLDYGVHQ